MKRNEKELKSLVVYTYCEEKNKKYYGIANQCSCEAESLEELNNELLQLLDGGEYKLKNEFVDNFNFVKLMIKRIDELELCKEKV